MNRIVFWLLPPYFETFDFWPHLLLKSTVTTVPTINREIFCMTIHILKTPGFFFLQFAPFSIKVHFINLENEEQTRKRILQRKETGFKVMKLTIMTVPKIIMEILRSLSNHDDYRDDDDRK